MSADAVFADAQARGQEDPLFLLANLKQQAGLRDQDARHYLRERGIEPGELIDPRVDTLDRTYRSGFVR